MFDYFKFMGRPYSYWATVEDERDEARAIAGELARFIRAIPALPPPPYEYEACDAYDAIRPGVRKWLEK